MQANLRWQGEELNELSHIDNVWPRTRLVIVDPLKGHFDVLYKVQHVIGTKASYPVGSGYTRTCPMNTI